MAATVAVEMSGDEARLWRAQQKVLAQQAKITNEYKKVAKEAKEAKKQAEAHAKAVEESFGNRAETAITSYAMGFLSIQGAISGVIQLLRDMNQASEEAAERAIAAASKVGQLSQLAGSGAERQDLKDKARQLVAMGAAPNQGEAAAIVQGIEGAGAMGSFDLLARAKASDFIDDPAKVAEAANTIMNTMGVAEAGSIDRVFSKAVAGADIAPGGVPDVMLAASKGGAMASALGLSDEELIAGTAIAAKGAGSAPEGGTQMTALLKGFAETKGYKGLSLDQMIAKATSENESFSDMKDLLGRTEAINALNSLQKMNAEYRQLLGDVRAADKVNLVEERIALNEADPELAAAQAARRAGGLRTLAEDDALAEGGLLAKTIADEQSRRALEERGQLAQWVADRTSDFERLVMGNKTFAAMNAVDDPASQASQQALIESNNRLADVLKLMIARSSAGSVLAPLVTGQGPRAPSQRAQQASVATQ